MKGYLLGAESKTRLDPPFVGREKELALLDGALAEALDERAPRIALVVAPPGTGKSRLARELRRRWECREGLRILEARAEALARSSPTWVLEMLLRGAAGIPSGPSTPANAELLRQHLHSLGRELPDDVADFLHEMLGLPSEQRVDQVVAHGDAAAHAVKTRQCVFLWLEALAKRGPLIIVLEDVHWADDASLGHLREALSKLRDASVFLLALARPELVGRFHPGAWPHLLEHKLAPLGDRAAERLVRHLDAGMGEEQLGRIVARAAGNPLFLEELVRFVHEGRGGELPATVLAVLEARLDVLDVESRQLVRAASVFGERFSLEGLAAITRSPALELAPLLAALVHAQVLHLDADGFAFRHALVREAAYAMLTAEDRRLAHDLTGDWLATRGTARSAELAQHFALGREPARAAPHHLQAARDALFAGDLEGTLEQAQLGLERASDPGLIASLHSQRAKTLAWQLRFGEVLVEARAALAHEPEGSPGWVLGTSAAVMALVVRGQAREAMAQIQPLFGTDFRGLYSPADADMLYSAPWCLLYLGERAASRVLCAKAAAVELSRPEHEPMAKAWRYFMDAKFAIFSEGDPWAAYVLAARAARLLDADFDAHEASRDKSLPIGGFTELVGGALLTLGQFEEGERISRHALARAERAGNRWIVGWARANALLAPSRRRALSETCELQRSATLEYRTLEIPILAGIFGVGLASTMAMMGEVSQAIDEASSAAETLAAFPPMRAVALATRASMLNVAGDPRSALEDAERSMDLAERHGTWIHFDYAARLAAAEALIALGRREDARQILFSARDKLMNRAARIPEQDIRSKFLGRVRTNARILELAAAWSD